MSKQGNKVLDILKRIMGTICVPTIIYFIIMFIAIINGQTFFGNGNTWRNILLNTAATATTAYALAIQFKLGKLDFSGGAVVTLGAIITIFIVKNTWINAYFFFALSVIICTFLSLIVANLYVWARIPIIICTIGMAILYEAISLLFNGGNGGSISTFSELNFFGKDVRAVIGVTFLSAAIYYIYMKLTVSGRRGQLLGNNPLAAVNIGIKENRNVIASFVVSGVLYGIAAVVYASQSYNVYAVSSILGTVKVAFSSLLPVCMGFYIGKLSTDAIGILAMSFAIGIIDYGIEIIAPVGSAGFVKNIVMGVFLVAFFLVSNRGGDFVKFVNKKSNASKSKEKEYAE